MKNFKLRLLFVMTLLTAIGCGKKPHHESVDLKKELETQSEIYFMTVKELTRSVTENDLVALKALLEKYPTLNLNQQLNDGETLLTYAIKKDHKSIRDLLVLKGASLEKTNVYKETPIMAAVSTNRIETVKLLLEKKVRLNRRDTKGNTALHTAISKKLEELALLLITSGADLEIANAQGKNPYQVALDVDSSKVIELIKSVSLVNPGSPNVETFKGLIISGNIKVLDKMLARFPSLVVDYDAINPLKLALDLDEDEESEEMFKLLLKHKANVNGPQDCDMTPLLRAIQLQKINLVKTLLDAKADPHIIDKQGLSALIHAIKVNHPELVRLFLKNGLDKKYSVLVNNKKESVNACTIAKAVGNTLTTESAKESNKTIKDVLVCGLIRKIF